MPNSSYKLLAASILAAACCGLAAAQGKAPAKKSGDDVPAGSTSRGMLVLGPAQKVFTPCGSDREYWVSDKTVVDRAAQTEAYIQKLSDKVQQQYELLQSGAKP